MVKTAAAAPKIEDEEKKAEEAGDYPPLFKAGDKVEPRARVNLPVPMLPESVLSSSTNTSATASSTVTNNGGSKGNISKEEKEQEEQQEQEEEQDDDEDDDHDVLDTITYEVYKPQKLGFGRPHPDPVVENATLASVEPPEITYTLAIPKNVISKGILSDLQLEALVYGCQCHELDLPSSSSSSTSSITITSTTASNDKKISPNKRESPESNRYGAKKEKEEAPPVRRGFMLGDGAGMGKGRTLAGMILENMSRGRTKHIWVSVSSDLYEDAKRDLTDLGLEDYANKSCHLLGKLKYSTLKSQNIKDGTIFCTYRTLIGTATGNKTRLKQLVAWCDGEDFDGLILLDECHKAKNILLDADGNAQKVGTAQCSKTAAAVVDLQRLLPRARIVYCSATAVSEPNNLGFMSRLGLWGKGTEHPGGFGQFLFSIERLGRGAMELHAMYLKSKGAMVARTLSYEGCEFEAVNNAMSKEMEHVYNQSTDLWKEMHVALLNAFDERRVRAAFEQKMNKKIEMGRPLEPEEKLQQEIYADSDDEDDYDSLTEQEALYRRKCRNRPAHILKGVFWGSHQRYFRSLCISSKIDRCIETVNQSLADGHCCVIGLQSTGEARAKAAADQVDFESKDDGALVMEDYISDSKEGLKRTLMNIFPLPPKPRGVKPPAFLKTVLADREKYTDGLSDDPATSDASNPARESLPARKSARVRDLYKPNSAMYGLSSEDEDSSHGHHEEDDRMTSSSNASSEDEDMGLLSDDDDDDDADAAERRREETDKLRHVNYAEAIQRLERWFQAVNSLALPPNALDRLLNELGGPEMVAEMTGRRTRQIQRLVNGKLKTVFEKREAAGALDQINIEERDHFQNGRKYVAIISEAASTGVSLQADKRVTNKRRRVHLTLELPWSADKAIQQLGRTHRSNQSSAPIYKFLLSKVGGEARFASAVAKKLQSLGALTQGDRRATGSAQKLGLGGYDIDDEHGSNALKAVAIAIEQCGQASESKIPMPDLPDEDVTLVVARVDSVLERMIEVGKIHESNWQFAYHHVVADRESSFVDLRDFAKFNELFQTPNGKLLADWRAKAIKDGRSFSRFLDEGCNDESSGALAEHLSMGKEKGLNFLLICNVLLNDVGLQPEELYSERLRRKKKTSAIPRFLNRVLGMRLEFQEGIIRYFFSTLNAVVREAKNRGQYDLGIKKLSGGIKIDGVPRVFRFRGLNDPEENILLYKVKNDQGIDRHQALEIYEEAKRENQENGRVGQPSNQIKTGFYIDDRPRWKVTSKVFLIIQQSSVTVTKTVLVVRPNIGRRYRGAVQTRRYIQDNYKFCGNKQMLQRALALWEKEFNLANIASDSQYQFSCPGRLSETMIFTGHIAPVLMSIVAILNKGKSLDSKYFKLPTVVRAETGRSNEDSDDAEGRSTLLAGIPILSTEQDDCRAAMEERYEVAFHGKIPSYIVGLEIPASIDDSDEDGKGLVELLAERMEKKGVETARQVFNLVEAEKHQASIPGVTGKKLKVCL